jgi:hypothetical protein
MIATAVYGDPAKCPTGPSCETGWNLGAVNYVQSNGQSVCGQAAGSKSIVDVSTTTGQAGEADLDPSCVAIDTSNNTVPDIMTYYSVTPQYSGTYNDLASINPNYENAAGQSVSFWALAHPMVQLSASPATLSVNAGSSVSTTLTVTSILGYGYAGRTGSENNYSLPLDLQCQGLPAYASCTFTYSAPNPADPNAPTNLTYNSTPSPSNPQGLLCTTSTAANPLYCAVDVGPNPGTINGRSGNHGGSSTTPCSAIDGCLGPGTVTMTINTNVPLGTSSKVEKDKGGIAFAALFGLGLFGIVLRRKAAGWERLLMVICVLILGGAFAGITACSTKILGTESTAAVTPSGSYWVTVTAKEAGTLVIQCSNGPTCVNGYELVPGSGTQMSLPFTVYVTIGQ